MGGWGQAACASCASVTEGQIMENIGEDRLNHLLNCNIIDQCFFITLYSCSPFAAIVSILETLTFHKYSKVMIVITGNKFYILENF